MNHLLKVVGVGIEKSIKCFGQSGEMDEEADKA